MSWPKCLQNTAALNDSSKGRLSDQERIWINVFSFLVAVVILVISFFLYRMFKTKKRHKHSSDIGVMTVIDGDKCELFSHAQSQELDCTENIDTHRLQELIEFQNIKKLTEFLKSVDTSPDRINLQQNEIDEARDLLQAWKTNRELGKICNKTDKHLNTWELTNLQNHVRKAETSLYREQINTLGIAVQLLQSEIQRQNKLNNLKVQITKEMQSNNLHQLQLLADEVEKNELRDEFKEELKFIRDKLKFSTRDKTCSSADMRKRLQHAIAMRDSLNLTTVVQEAELSNCKTEVHDHLVEAKKLINELQEIKLLIEKHRLIIEKAKKSQNIELIQQTLLDTKLNGLGETLKDEIFELEMILKNKQLFERLKTNFEKAVESSDSFKIKQAVSDLKASGFKDMLEKELIDTRGETH